MKRSLVILLLMLAGFGAVGPVSAEQVTFRHENVLGTSLELRIDAPDESLARRAETTALGEIDRLASLLSRHAADSELSRWQRGEVAGDSLSVELRDVLSRAERWRLASGGAFDVRAQALSRLWTSAAEKGSLPTDAERAAIVAQLNAAPWTLHEDGSIERHDALPISLDALAKGYILDEVGRVVRETHPEVSELVINIGGDLRKFGDTPLEIEIADPSRATVGATPLQRFEASRPFALATSGGYHRHVEIAGRRFSHIIDPRSGFPASGIRSASVIAPTAVEADAAATVLNVLEPSEGLRLIESLSGLECLIVAADGSLFASAGWPNRSSLEPLGERLVLTSLGAEDEPGLHVEFTIGRPAGGRYRRPYVAVWLEDEDGFPVRTAVLWIMTEQPGPRWHRDLTRWFRNDRVRKLVEENELIGTISEATRGPGDYSALFDGNDNAGKRLPPGKYVLCIESAREHGSYQLIKETLELGDRPIERKELAGNDEVTAASYRYVPLPPEGERSAPENEADRAER